MPNGGSPLVTGVGRRVWLGTVEVTPTAVDERAASYESLRGVPPLWQSDLRFLSPTYFSRSARDYLLPHPALIVRSLVTRWNEHVDACSPLAVDEAEARELGLRILLKAHELHTVRVTGADRPPANRVRGPGAHRVAHRRAAHGRRGGVRAAAGDLVRVRSLLRAGRSDDPWLGRRRGVPRRWVSCSTGRPASRRCWPTC